VQILRAYKTELDPNNKQRSFFQQCAGAARFVYNWGLATWGFWYFRGQKPSRYKLCKYFNAIKDEESPWIRDLPYAVTEKAFYDLGAAFQHYFRQKKDGTVAQRIAKLRAASKWARRCAKLLAKGRRGPQIDPGYPRFKARQDHNQSFGLRDVRIEECRVRLTGIGWVRLKECNYLPTVDSGLKLSTYATLSCQAGRWYISVQVYKDVPEPEAMRPLVIGADLGVKMLVVLSNGEMFENPRPLYEAERKLTRLQREYSRRQKGSANREKTVAKIQRCHARIANIRKHALHNISHHVTAELRPSVIVLEDLNVEGMLQNHRLAKAIADVGFYELRRQLEYKAEQLGIEVILADRWFASSKTCHQCGRMNEDLGLSDRVFECPDCGLVMDRDLNAAKNLAALAA